MRHDAAFRALRLAGPAAALLAATACASAAGAAPGTSVPSRPAASTSAPLEVPPPSAGPHDSFESFFASHLAGTTWREAVVRDNLETNAVILPAALAVGALAVRPWDGTLERHAEGAFGNREVVGNVGQVLLVASSVGLGWFAPGEGRSREDEMWTQGEAFALALGTTGILKAAVGRSRPNSSDTGSFPSGHATAAFAAATLIERNSGPMAGAFAYAAAAVTAFSRVEAGTHFPSDVLAGAAIGTFAASIIDSLHFGKGGVSSPESDRHNVSFEITPTERGTEFAVVFRF